MKNFNFITVALLVFSAPSLQAVPVLQVGACTNSECTNYITNTTQGSDEDTAFTSSNPFTLAVAGAWKKGSVQLGGKYEGTPAGSDWSAFNLPSAFDENGAILVASIEDGILSGINDSGVSITLDNQTLAPFFFSQSSYFPDEHYPVKEKISDFLFFDLGNLFGPFSYTTAQNGKPSFDGKGLGLIEIPDFQDNGTGDGVIKTLQVTINNNALKWVHFDVMALETSVELSTGKEKTIIASTSENKNPGSHDVTWYRATTSPPGGGGDDNTVPEPSSIWLLVIGLLGGVFGVRRPWRFQSAI